MYSAVGIATGLLVVHRADSRKVIGALGDVREKLCEDGHAAWPC